MPHRRSPETTFLNRDLQPILIPLLMIGFLYSIAASMVAAQPLQEADLERLSGDWALNEDLSDDPREKMSEAMQQVRGSRGGAGRGGGGGRGRGVGGRDGGGPMTGSVAMRVRELSISLDADTLVLRSGSGQSQTIDVGQIDSAETEETGTAVYWEGPRLVVESTGTDAPGRREVYEVVADADRLVVTLDVHLPMGGDPISIRRVFDRVED